VFVRYADYAELEAQLVEVLEALRPFTHGDLCAERGGNVEGDASPIYGRGQAILTLGNFRCARDIVTKHGGT
jgi:hypothetical protein